MNSLLFVGIFISFFICVMGLLTRKFPSAYGTNTGINTTHARKSKDSWDYTQKNGPKYFIIYGLISLLINGCITIGALYIPRVQFVGTILTISISISCFVYAFVKVESMLKEFDKNHKVDAPLI